MVSGKDYVMITYRVIEKIFCNRPVIFRSDYYLGAAQVVPILVAQKISLAAECAGQVP